MHVFITSVLHTVLQFVRVCVVRSIRRVDVSAATTSLNPRTARLQLRRVNYEIRCQRRHQRSDLPVGARSTPSRRVRTTLTADHPRSRRCRLRERTSSKFSPRPTTRAVARRHLALPAASAEDVQSRSTTSSTADFRFRL